MTNLETRIAALEAAQRAQTGKTPTELMERAIHLVERHGEASPAFVDFLTGLTDAELEALAEAAD